MHDHRVDHPSFQGPLDLLLHLIRSEEMDIHDIPTRELVDQRLVELGLSAQERLPLSERVPVAARDRAAFFGAELPAGLQLSDADG